MRAPSPFLLAAVLALAALAASRADAQESPATLTRAEYQCQKAFAHGLLAAAGGAGKCLAECRSSPGRRCSISFPDPITGDCLERSRASAEGPLQRACAGFACPECYDGGSCSFTLDSALSQAISTTDAALSVLYCDDSSSRDGLTRAEQRCQRGLGGDGGRFIDTIERCFTRCQQGVQRGSTRASSCDPAFIDGPLDPRTQRCVDRARARLLDGCENHCADPPDCFAYTCPAAALAVEQQALALGSGAYCQEPGVCGDGAVTGAERCDDSAAESGCGLGERCDFGCQRCVPVCGDGILLPSEACDDSANPSFCGTGMRCASGCGRCEPVCGDGLVVAGEACDESASITNCADGLVCRFCSFCEDPCGNFQDDPGEVCEREHVDSCALGSACTATCDACTATESLTESFPTCNFTQYDEFTFQVSAGQNVVVRLDNLSSQTAAGLELYGSCTSGQFFSDFGSVPCTVPGPTFCAADSFVTFSDATCTVTIYPYYCPAGSAQYRLDVSGTGLELTVDDGVAASPSGAFVDAPSVAVL